MNFTFENLAEFILSQTKQNGVLETYPLLLENEGSFDNIVLEFPFSNVVIIFNKNGTYTYYLKENK